MKQATTNTANQRNTILVGFILSTMMMITSLETFAYDIEGQDNKAEVNFGYVTSQESYDLKGSGFTTNSGMTTGNGMSGSINYRATNANYSFEYFTLTQENSAPTGVTPSKVDTTFTRFAFLYQPNAEGAYGDSDAKLFKMNYGFESRQRESDLTSPNQFISNHTSVGFRLGGTYYKVLNELTYINAGAGLFLPLYHDEAKARTGYYKFSLNPDVGIYIGRKLGSMVDFTVGAKLFYESIYYSGTGNRGTSKAEETFLDLVIPFEFKFKF